MNVEATDKDGWTPLYLAAKNGHEAIVQLLLEKEANVEATDKDGRTPLYLAESRGHAAVVNLLQPQT